METHIANHNDRHQFNDLQSLLCATLQSVLRKVDPEDAPKISDAIMTALLTMFDSSKVGGVQEDALIAVSTLVDLLGEGFIKYMDAFKPYLYMCLKNNQEYQVCCAAVGLTGDICRNLKAKVLPYCNDIMGMLLLNLDNANLHRSVKPQILAAFGDVALSIGSNFVPYLEMVLTMLLHASQVRVDTSDFDMMDYLNELRESVLEAYTGIIQGLKGPGSVALPEISLIENHLGHIINFVKSIAQDGDVTDTNIAIAAGLIGDLCSAYGSRLVPLLEDGAVASLLNEGKRSKNQRTKTLSAWATKEIKKIREGGLNPISQ